MSASWWRYSSAGVPPSALRLGEASTVLGAEEVIGFVADALAPLARAKRVCVIVPDATRACPLRLLLFALSAALDASVKPHSVLVALGTHPPMGTDALVAHLGGSTEDLPGALAGASVLQHAWWDPAHLVQVGEIPASLVRELSGGQLSRSVPVKVNKAVLDHDVALLVGPVLPHEVVGFSGGNKYLFPGVSGPEVVDVSHWLGALLTSAAIIGTTGQTPVRALIDEAASMVPVERLALCAVTSPGGEGLHALSVGSSLDAWEQVVQVAAAAHVRYLPSPVQRVVSIVPSRYRDLWTGAKGFYKVEPVVADGGEVVLFAPHIRELAPAHPGIAEIGYHCRDYFLANWDRFGDRPLAELAHSTHLAGAGTYDPSKGESRRVHVKLATAIPEALVRSVGLDYLDPASLDLEELARDPSTLVVKDAGEQLYRLAPSAKRS
jgi:nickel-dependent lactate racemase